MGLPSEREDEWSDHWDEVEMVNQECYEDERAIDYQRRIKEEKA